MDGKRTEVSKDEIESQKSIMQSVRKINEERARGTTLAFVDTYGCQQNEADSELLRGMLLEMGYTLTDSERLADVIVINTCAIRENAENRVFGNIGALVHTKHEKPEQIIAVCGCMAGRPGAAAKIKESYKHISLVFPPQALWRFPELLLRALTVKKRVFEHGGEDLVAEGLPAMRDGTVKAWLSVMYGCNNYCSYCIVPYVRGRERSRSPQAVIKDAEKLIKEGYKDITLLGQNVNSYGNDLGGAADFSSLIRSINEIPGDFLIRFMTSHPKDADENLFRTMAQCEKAARHIHLPFQSGNDRVLRQMNRKYTSSEYLKKVCEARRYMPDIVITSDVIVGFPGETEAEFEDTLNLIKEVRFDALFTFIYSKRPGTKAAELEETFTRAQIQSRFDRLTELQNKISDEIHTRSIGKTVRVLVDGHDRGEKYPVKARTNGGRLVHLSCGTEYIGRFADVKITHCNSWSLFGDVCEGDIKCQ